MGEGDSKKQSPQQITQTLYQEYVQSDSIDTTFDLIKLFHTPKKAKQYRKQRITVYANQLNDMNSCKLAVNTMECMETIDEIVYYETVLRYAGVLIDIINHYPNIERRYTTKKINDSFRSGYRNDAGLDHIRQAGQKVCDLAQIICTAEWIIGRAEEARLAHPDDTIEQIQKLLQEQIEAGDEQTLGQIEMRFKNIEQLEWGISDIMKFDSREFEQLLAALWSDHDNDAWTTPPTRDGGCDVVVHTQEDDLLLVEAKCFNPRNRNIPVGMVREVAGLLTRYPVDAVVFVTTTSFTESSKEFAAGAEDVQLVNGSQLCEFLTASSLCPPTVPEY